MKNVLITGVSRGIGRALALKFLDSGYFVLGTSTSGVLDYNHENLRVFKLDLSNRESIEYCAEEIKKSGLRVDILINNAGVWSNNENDTFIHRDLLERVLNINVVGVADFTERIIPLINKGGHIVNISSSAGSLSHTHHSNYPDYKISKAALNMITRALSVRLAGQITVSSMHPGWVKTDMGGSDADIEPAEAAEDIFKIASNSNIETGQFWFKGEVFPW